MLGVYHSGKTEPDTSCSLVRWYHSYSRPFRFLAFSSMSGAPAGNGQCERSARQTSSDVKRRGVSFVFILHEKKQTPWNPLKTSHSVFIYKVFLYTNVRWRKHRIFVFTLESSNNFQLSGMLRGSCGLGVNTANSSWQLLCIRSLSLPQGVGLLGDSWTDRQRAVWGNPAHTPSSTFGCMRLEFTVYSM